MRQAVVTVYIDGRRTLLCLCLHPGDVHDRSALRAAVSAVLPGNGGHRMWLGCGGRRSMRDGLVEAACFGRLRGGMNDGGGGGTRAVPVQLGRMLRSKLTACIELALELRSIVDRDRLLPEIAGGARLPSAARPAGPAARARKQVRFRMKRQQKYLCKCHVPMN